MPLFFFVSGCFYKPTIPIYLFVKKKIKQLLIPWCFFSLILFLLLMSLTFYSTHNFYLALMEPLASVWLGLLGDESSYCLFHTIWFLVALFEVSILYHIIYKLIKNVFLLTICCLGLHILGFVFSFNQIDLPYFIDTVLSILIFYHLGFYFRNSQYDKKEVSFGVAVVGLVLLFVCIGLLSPTIDIKTNVYPFYLLILSFSVIVCFYYLFSSLKTPNMNLLKRCGIESLLLMGIHQPIFDILPALYNKLNLPLYILDIPVVYLWGILWVIVTAGFILFISKYLHRYIPFIIGR